MTSSKGHPRIRKIWHIFRFKERYELDSYERKNGLEFTREFVAAGGSKSNDSGPYLRQLEQLHSVAGTAYHEVYGIFISLRRITAVLERPYRGYLLDADLSLLSYKAMARELRLEIKQLRRALEALKEVRLIEHIEMPDLVALDVVEGQDESISKRSERVSSPCRKGKGKRKGTASGNGLKEKRQGQIDSEDKTRQPPKVQAKPPSTPATTPPSLPTEADAQGADRSKATEGLLGSDMAAHLAALDRRLRGLDPQPPPEISRYSDRANLFASEIYLALGLNYGRTMAAREHGCFAARWTEVEQVGLPPPMADRLWDHAVRTASKLRKRRAIKKPGGMFCRIWGALLAKAKAGTLP
jgi:hypothetical protein